ncbi:MAG: hypothetical protein E7562_04580 [Ruminococcaceae bacterium]|nr:hypothetical protein [Oscillospiraceae bacterium]
MCKRLMALLLVTVMLITVFAGCKEEKKTAVKFGNLDYSFSYPTEDVTKVDIPENIDKNTFLSGLNFIDDDTPVIIPTKVEAGKRTPGKPYAVDVKYDDGTGVCVAIYDVVADFGACNDGTKDATPAIQRALIKASGAGGGVVYMPEGIYLCENTLEIPAGVTLRGEWVSPDVSPVGSCGTVILVKSKTRGRETGSAFIKMKAGAGLRNVNILYPEQTASEVAKYPATIQEAGGDSFTVMNTTIAGCWNGYQGNLNWSELHYMKNVYITAFNNAIMLDNVTDIGRLEGIHLSPEYLIQNTLYPFEEEDKQIIRDYMFQFAVGLWMQRSDWEYIYDFYAEGLYCAIRQVYNKEKRAANAQYCKIDIKNCNIGIDIQATNAIGCVFSEINITGDEKCTYGVLMNAGFSETSEFQNVTISGKIKEQFVCLGTGALTVLNSKFVGRKVGSYALTMYKGSVSIQQCEFDGEKRHIQIASECGGVSVMGCSFGGNADIKHDKTKEAFIKIDHTPLNLPVTSGRLHVYRRSIPTASSNAVYNVEDFGAKSGEDSTKAFVDAIAAAKKTGGIVYVPQGEFIVNQNLVIPTGVELRGIYNVPTHSVTKGSTICTTLGKGNANGEPFVSLEEGSGINGISFYYPEQSYTDFIPYPWTVRSLGKNCWAINSVFINSYQALDFATNPSDGHYINYCSGAPLVKGMFIGNNSSNGWVENCQFNPHYWKRAVLSQKPAGDGAELNNVINETLDVFIFGDNKSEHMLGNFAYGGENLLVLVSQGKGGLNGTVVGHGSDGCRNALVVEEADVVEFINAELVSMNGEKDMHHIVMKESVTGTVALYNSMMWAQPKAEAIKMNGGRLVVNQLSYYNLEDTTFLVNATGGEIYYCAVMMPSKACQVRAVGGATVHLIGNISRQSLAFMAPVDGAKVTMRNDGAKVTETATWWS